MFHPGTRETGRTPVEREADHIGFAGEPGLVGVGVVRLVQPVVVVSDAAQARLYAGVDA